METGESYTIGTIGVGVVSSLVTSWADDDVRPAALVDVVAGLEDAPAVPAAALLNLT